MTIGIGMISALIIGFMAGLLTLRRSERWCPHHGTTKVCMVCERSMPPMAMPHANDTPSSNGRHHPSAI